MDTQVLKPSEKTFETAADIIRGGGLVAFPTETVYGLGANALDENAVRSIYAAKGRPSDNPLIVHLSAKEDISLVAREIPPIAKKLIDAFMPGPLTIVLKRRPEIPDAVTAGLDTVAVRIPSNRHALALLRACAVPVAAPSANSSSRPSPTSAKHVFEDLNGKIPLIIDGGSCDVGIESTVLSAADGKLTILRPGKVTAEDTFQAAGITPAIAVSTPDDSTAPMAPGMKYRHYAPSCEAVAFYASHAKEAAQKALFIASSGGRAGVAALEDTLPLFGLAAKFSLGNGAEDAANRLFSVFRQAEKVCDTLFVQIPGGEGLSLSVKNRILKACSNRVLGEEE